MGTAKMGSDPATSVVDRFGRAHDVLTRSMTHEAAAPDGRRFEEILTREGMQSLKAARDAQYGEPWLRPLAPSDRTERQ